MTEPRAGSSRGSQYGSFESGPTHPLFENTITMYTREVEWLLNEALRKTGKGELTLSQTGPKRTIEEQNHARLIARDSNILHLLAALPDICLVFTELCRLTEIKPDVGTCLSSLFRLQNGRYDYKIRNERPYGRVLFPPVDDPSPPFIWINIIKNNLKHPVIVDCKTVTQDSSKFDLLGVVYNIDGEFRAAFVDSDGQWRGANGAVLQLRNFILFAVSVLYERQPLHLVEPNLTLPTFVLSTEEKAELLRYHGMRFGAGGTNPPHCIQDQNVYNTKLTPSQKAACQVLQIQPRTPFLITEAQYNALMTFIKGNLDKWDEILHNEGMHLAYTCTVYKGALYYCRKSVIHRDGSHLCCRCLVFPTLSFNGLYYCDNHIPDSRATFWVFIEHPTKSRSKEPLQVNWSALDDNHRSPKPTIGFGILDNSVRTCTSYSDLYASYFVYRVAVSTYHFLRGTKTQCRKLLAPKKQTSTISSLLITESHTNLAKQIFSLLNIAVNVSDADELPTQNHILEWNIVDVGKFGFTFGTIRANSRNIYMLQTPKNCSHEKVYIGKNSGRGEISHYRRNFDPNIMTLSTLASTSNLDMIEFLESTIMHAVALASVFGLRIRGSNRIIELENQYLENPKKMPLDTPQSDYLNIMLRIFFNRRVAVRTLP